MPELIPTLSLTECPRDAMQGLGHFVPTEDKIAYHRLLLAAGFPVLDFGSFVSPKAIPQMADTAQVLAAIAPHKHNTKLLAIVANLRGAEQAAAADGLDIQGFPLSVSEQFQQRNTGKSIQEALSELAKIAQAAHRAGQSLTVYLSMAFGNPYGELVSAERLAELTRLLVDMGVTDIALSDTVGKGEPAEIATTFTQMQRAFPTLTWICHLHARKAQVQALAAAAIAAGCNHLDTALGGYGGCPLSGDALTGNLDTDAVLAFAAEAQLATGINIEALAEARALLPRVFHP